VSEKEVVGKNDHAHSCNAPQLDASAHLAIILPVAEPAHPVAALNVAARIEGVLRLDPVLGYHLLLEGVRKTMEPSKARPGYLAPDFWHLTGNMDS
jgi:hypothetical protein